VKLTLNIGLNIGATTAITSTVAKQILIANGFVLGRETLVASDTEPALVVEAYPSALHNEPVGNRLYQSALDLQQDCIAVWNPAAGKGALIGPGAAKWGAFNPAFFFDLEGRRLSEVVTQ